MAAPLLVLLLAAAGPASGAGSWRLAVEPGDAGEAAVREAAAGEGPSAVVAALDAVAQAYAATPASGLAHLAAGLRLLDAGRAQEALAHLAHADIEKTLLRDHAFLAVSRAEEALGRTDEAARAALAAADQPGSAVSCEALPKAAELFARARQVDAALAALARTADSCPAQAPAALLELGAQHQARGEPTAAATAYDRLERGHPLSAEAKQARARLRGLAGALPPRPAPERARELLARGDALLAARRTREAVAALRAVPLASLPPEERDLARVRLAAALLAAGRRTEGRNLLRQITPASPHAAEAAFQLAREDARRTRAAQPFVAVADRFPGTAWGEEALLALANHYQKDALDEAAAPWWRRLLAEYPDGRYVERAAFRVGLSEFRAGRYQAAAGTFETTARLRPPSSATAGLLYWSARARLQLGQTGHARALLEETVQRYKHAYHGVRAQDALSRLGPSGSPKAAVSANVPPPEPPLPEPRASRARQLLLVGRLDEAATELGLLPETPRVTATLAWVDWRRGRLRPAITAMKRAYPEWVGEAGDRLPGEVWQILFPLRYEQEMLQKAREEGLDPALLAALILQESSYDTAALSRAGARGLMQVMPTTGRTIARAKGKRFKRAALHDPETSLDFGTHYLRQMSERYSGAAEKVLAAYNAGPHRVDAWTRARGELAAEEFIETIPFSETRAYVMIVLANREHYRRLYGLARSAPGPVVEGARP